ncbi:lipoprotein-34 [Candidatus Symbiobacter mobilis CR]|uniref:Lipoprotein-34 n=1 Tax=Candidatus Symbiobacter mobilis CR TaxID=946483 RepID=U5N4P0_9BURK|nr:lipoprotein-34 [Candidatus Symbiobacter mobilis CR]
MFVLGIHVVCIAVLSACSALQTDKVDYRSATQAPPLEVPPDLTRPSTRTPYVVGGAAVTATGFLAGRASAPQAPVGALDLGTVRMGREGSQRWLSVALPANKLWDDLKDFWQEHGFVLVTDRPDLGIMETDWAENRAKLPQDFLRNALGKVLDGLYSTGERDRFRTRLEANPQGGTDIFITHRGMVEVYSTAQKDQTVWQPRAADPELEAEFLRRFMVRLGMSAEQAQTALTPEVIAKQGGVRVRDAEGAVVLEMDEDFDKAWRRVGLTLDRTNFTVEDRDRAKGIYYVRYVAPKAEGKDAGFFGSLFRSKPLQPEPQQYQIVVAAESQRCVVSVLRADGSSAAMEDAQRIIALLAQDLR